MTSKIRKHSMVGKKPTTVNTSVKTVEQEYFREMFTLKMCPVSNDYLMKFALEWVEWVETNEGILTRKAFFNAKHVLSATVNGWMKRCPELRDADAFVRQLIGDRREMGVIDNKIPESWVKHSHSLYDEDYKDLEQWRNAMKEKIAGSSSGTIRVVELDRYPDSPLVPRKKVDE